MTIRAQQLFPTMRRGLAIFTVAHLLTIGLLTAQQRSPETATIGPLAQIVPPMANYHFPDGQTYVYAVEWHMFNAGIARVQMQQSGSQKKITAIADSLGVVNLLYTIHDHFEAYVDARSNCSQRIVKHTEEGKRKRETQAQFDYPRRKSVLTERDLKTGQTKRIESDVPSCVTDVVTGFFYLASQPLNIGSAYVFPMSDGGKTTEVTAKVEGKDQVKVPAGSFASVRMVAEPTSGPLKGKGKVSAWFSEDGHVPVKMQSKLGWGTLLFRLQRIEK